MVILHIYRMVNHLRRVVVFVSDFEKALYFPGLPNDNEMDFTSCNRVQFVYNLFWQKGNSKKTFSRPSKRKSGIKFSCLSSLDIFLTKFSTVSVTKRSG